VKTVEERIMFDVKSSLAVKGLML